MGFQDTLGKMLGEGIKKVQDYAQDYKDSFNKYYDYYAERYADMTNEQLKHEAQRLQNGNGNDSKRLAQIKAMKEEIERRRNG